MTNSEKLQTLLQWCNNVGIRIDSRLSVVENKDTGSISVRSCSGSYIDTPTTLVTIPKSAVLSARSCTLSDKIPYVPYGHGAHLSLSIALYGELLQRSSSRWSGYLLSLPQTAVGIALLWGTDQLSLSHDPDGARDICEDLRQASILAMGTEILAELYTEDGEHVLDEVRAYYATVAEPLLTNHAAPFHISHQVSLSGFLHVYSLVSSRAFLVDAYHGLAMVPIADAFDHTQDNHVHLESEHDVCVVCGSFLQCPHDQDDAEDVQEPKSGSASVSAATPSQSDPAHSKISGSRRDIVSDTGQMTVKTNIGIHAPTAGDAEADTCDMVSNIPIAPYSEVFNTYGERLTNAQLLARYGFSLDGNENDVVTFWTDDLPNLHQALPGAEASVIDTARRILVVWPSYERWNESSLVYQADRIPLSPSALTTSMSPSSAAHHGDDEVRPECRGEEGDTLRRRRVSFTPMHMCVNSDAKISHGLWVCCALLSLGHVHSTFHSVGLTTFNDVASALVRLAERQLYWEAQSELAMAESSTSYPNLDDDEGSANTHENLDSSNGLDKTLALLAQMVTWICTFSSRARRLGRAIVPDATYVGGDHNTIGEEATLGIEQLGGALDNVPSNRPYTRLALQQVLSERSILESCRCAWEEFGAGVRSD